MENQAAPIDVSAREGDEGGGAHRAATRRGKMKSEARTRKALKWMAPSQSASAAVVRSGEYAVPRNTAVPSSARSPLAAAAPLARPLVVVPAPIDPPADGSPEEESSGRETEKGQLVPGGA
nr:unnamed protein product [Digitaria exilis]